MFRRAYMAVFCLLLVVFSGATAQADFADQLISQVRNLSDIGYNYKLPIGPYKRNYESTDESASENIFLALNLDTVVNRFEEGSVLWKIINVPDFAQSVSQQEDTVKLLKHILLRAAVRTRLEKGERSELKFYRELLLLEKIIKKNYSQTEAQHEEFVYSLLTAVAFASIEGKNGSVQSTLDIPSGEDIAKVFKHHKRNTRKAYKTLKSVQKFTTTDALPMYLGWSMDFEGDLAELKMHAFTYVSLIVIYTAAEIFHQYVGGGSVVDFFRFPLSGVNDTNDVKAVEFMWATAHLGTQMVAFFTALYGGRIGLKHAIARLMPKNYVKSKDADRMIEYITGYKAHVRSCQGALAD